VTPAPSEKRKVARGALLCSQGAGLDGVRSGRGGLGDGGVARAEVVAVVVNIVGVHLREQESVDQYRDKNHHDEEIVSWLGRLRLTIVHKLPHVHKYD
jgi:hypothetical protein